MFASFGKSLTNSSVSFASQAGIEADIKSTLGLERELLAVSNTRDDIGKKSMVLNSETPLIEVDPETYEVRANGELLICEPADVLPLAQRYFLF